MPRTVEEGFRDFHSRLTPSTTESIFVQGHRASIETSLKLSFGITRFARIGSYGNGTSISGFSDVDYLACIPTKLLKQNSTTSLTNVRNSLDARFPLTGVRVNTPAVCCPFGALAAQTTEVIPADYLWELGGHPVYEIADGNGGWTKTSPDAHNAYVRDMDVRLKGKLKPLIRFFKAWKYHLAVPISSFYLEMLVAAYAASEQVIVYDVDVMRIMDLLVGHKLPTFQDPVGIAGAISACKTAAKQLDALSKVSTAAVRARKARAAAEREDIRDSFDWWRLLYNNQFPTYYV